MQQILTAPILFKISYNQKNKVSTKLQTTLFQTTFYTNQYYVQLGSILVYVFIKSNLRNNETKPPQISINVWDGFVYLYLFIYLLVYDFY